MVTLKILDIEGLAVPDSEVEALQEALPDLFIRR